ncbi:MAG TPA: hypothetical protein VML54_00825 [Candidatus Limnocylindrales bacterium]|nr:hypothetical protein [Candidatus Limnocylindrales bacterium]
MSAARRALPRLGSTIACAALVAAHAAAADAQQTPAGPSGAAEPQAPMPVGVSPRGALIRAMLVPGWGHVSIGSHTRGGFYFALEAATAYTFVRTQIRLNEARERAELRESIVLTRLAAEGVVDATEVQARLEADEPLQGLQALVDSREGQQEDLIAWSIFLVFLTGADAYVSAHLSGFPTPIEMDAAATPDGRAEVMLRIPLP